MKSSSTKNKNFILALTFFTFSLVSVYYLIVMISMQSNAYTLANPEIKNYMAFGETIEFQFETSFDSYIAFYMGVNDTFEIGFHNDKKSNTLVVNSGTWAEKEDSKGKPIFHLIPEYISSNGFNRITVTPIRGDGDYYISQVMVVPESEKSKYVSYNQIDFEIKQYHIELDDAAYQVILDNRAGALELGTLFTDDDSVVNGKVKAEGTNYSADIRLKGDWIDHLVGDQWSFRIELKGDYCIYGLQKFSLQPISTRNGIWEYLVNELYRDYGGIAIRYDFADVFVNGVYLGVFAVEEFMEKRVIENSLSREGPIVRYNENPLWTRWSYYNKNTHLSTIRDYTVFSEKKTTESGNLNDYASYAISMINRYLYEDESAEYVFDSSKYITLYSILDIFSAKHGRVEHNMRHYYNPVTALLEPIPFDENTDYIVVGDINSYFLIDLYLTNEFYALSTPATKIPLKAYISSSSAIELNENIKNTIQNIALYYPEFIQNNAENIGNFTKTIQRDDDQFTFNPFQVNNRIEQIMNLDSPEELEIEFTRNKELDSLQVTIYNPNPLCVKIVEVLQNTQIVEVDQVLIQAYNDMTFLLPFDDANISITWNTAYSDDFITEKTLETAFYVIGHPYGIPDDGNTVYPPVENYINSTGNNPFLEYGIFTGDISQYTEKDDYIYLKTLVEENNANIIAVPGNHDIWQNQTAFLEVFDQYFGVYEIESSLIITLDPLGLWQGETMDVSEEQIDMITKALERQEKYQNIFVFTHEVIWFEEGNERFGSFRPHLIYPNNFYSEILPLFENFLGNVYFIARDTGGLANNNEIYYESEGKYIYIASGVGGSRDNTLEFYVYTDGRVDIKLIALNGDDPNALGHIQYYSKGGYY